MKLKSKQKIFLMSSKGTLFSAVLFSKTGNIEYEEYHLGGFGYFQRSPLQEMLRFLSGRVVQNIDATVPQELVHKMDNGDSFKFFVKEKENRIYVLCAIIEYPSNTLSLLVEDISKCISEASEASEQNQEIRNIAQDERIRKKEKEKISDYIKIQLKEYQDYEKKDIMLQIKNELGRVEEILTKSVESALGRGEKIDELISSADSLSFQTKSLYKLSKKQNRRCCGIM